MQPNRHARNAPHTGTSEPQIGMKAIELIQCSTTQSLPSPASRIVDSCRATERFVMCGPRYASPLAKQ